MKRLHIADFKDRFINMHTHTTRCHHASGEDRAYVEKAIEAGFEVLGFSDHAPYLFENGYVSPMRMTIEELEGYVDSVLSLKREYAGDIEIYCGLEMEYFERLFDKTMAAIDQYPIDYMILGQHYYDETGKTSPKSGWQDEAHLKLYVDQVIAGLQTDRFFYVAHPDLMQFGGSKEIYRKHMLRLVQEMKRRGMPIEINMNGVRCGQHYPTPAFVELGVEQDCDFIVGVDAHRPEELVDFESYVMCKRFATERGGRVIHADRIFTP